MGSHIQLKGCKPLTVTQSLLTIFSLSFVLYSLWCLSSFSWSLDSLIARLSFFLFLYCISRLGLWAIRETLYFTNLSLNQSNVFPTAASDIRLPLLNHSSFLSAIIMVLGVKTTCWNVWEVKAAGIYWLHHPSRDMELAPYTYYA